MKVTHLLFISLLIVGLLFVPAVSANEIIFDEELSEFVDTSKSGIQRIQYTGGVATGGARNIGFEDITKAQTLHYLVFELPTDAGFWLNTTKIEPGRYDFTYHFNGADRPGVLYLNKKTNALGSVTSTVFTIFLNDWDIGDLTGRQSVTMPFYFHQGTNALSAKPVSHETNAFLYWQKEGDDTWLGLLNDPIQVTEVTSINWKHHVTVAEDSLSYYVNVNGFIDGQRYTSQVNFSKDGELIARYINSGEDLHWAFLKTDINLLEIISPQGTEYAYPLF